jgi:hypothetical protein
MTTRTFQFTVAAAPSGTPAWAAGLADRQVRNLTGTTYGPTNGKTSIADPTEGVLGSGVVPAVWNFRSQGWGSDDITAAWSGGRGDLAGRRLFVHGGGHADSANNGMYIYEFGTGDRPVGWKLAGTAYGTAGCSLSPIATAGLYNGGSDWGPGSDNVYADNRPTSVHSYDQSWFNSAQQRYYRFGGSAFESGTGITPVYYYDLAQDKWSSVLSGGTAWANIPGTDPASGTVSGTVMASPDESKMLFIGGSVNTLRMFTSAGSPTDLGAGPGVSNSAYMTAVCVDTGSRSAASDRWVTIDGQSGTARVLDWTINWNTNAVSWTVRSHSTHSTHLRTILNASSQDAPTSGGSLIYDHAYSQGPSIWIYGSVRQQVSTTALRELLCMKLSDWSIAAHTLTHDAVTPATWGSFSRHLWFPAYRVIATVQASTASVSVFKVPT